MSAANRKAAEIVRAHRFLKPLLERGRGLEVLFQSGSPRIGSRTLAIDGSEFVDFATTSYLGLDSDPTVVQACVNALRAGGLHRYISRAFFSAAEYRELESRLARVTGLPVAIVFPSATALHQALLPLLARKGTLVVADEQVHHSMHEALKACDGPEIQYTAHNDLAAMADLLSQKEPGSPSLILADGVYSLSGEVAPVEKLYDLAVRSESLLYLDDSHGFGVFGRHGEGVPFRLGPVRDHLVYVGSLSKALGCYGAFAGTSATLGAAIRDFAGGLLFSGPLPITLLAGAVAAADILLSPRLSELHDRLWSNQARAVAALRESGFEPMATDSAVLCVDFQSLASISQVIDALRENGILISAVSFPAVPRGHYRIRFSISASHTEEDMLRLADALQQARAGARARAEWSGVAVR